VYNNMFFSGQGIIQRPIVVLLPVSTMGNSQNDYQQHWENDRFRWI